MRIILILILLSSGLCFSQHVPLQSQYMFNGVALNPAYAGSDGALTLIGSYRAQWVGFPGAPRTNSFTGHAPLRKSNSGLGFQLYTDRIGAESNTGLFALYAYHIKMKKSTFSFGVAAGLNLISAQYANLQVESQNDQLLIADNPARILPDFSFGMHFHSKKYFLSFALPMFLTHRFNGYTYKLSNRFKNYNLMFGGGYVFEFKNAMKLKPSFLLKYRLHTRLQMDYNLRFSINETIDIGVSYRTEDAFIGMVEIHAGKQFSFMYSLGVPISEIVNYSIGSHELGVKYTFLYKSTVENPRFLGW